MTRALLLSFALAAPALPALAGEDPKCGPHEHLVVERDPDEGAMTKRCLCDAGWDADGPAPPCRERPKAPPAKAPPKPPKK